MGRVRKLRDLPAGSVVFVDANVLAPFFSRTDALGQSCAAFLERVAGEELRAIHLATNDADFKRVPWIQVWRPRA